MCRLRDRWPTVICQTWTYSKRWPVPSTEVRTLVGWHITDRLLRMCNVETAGSAGWTAPTENLVYTSMFRKRKVTSSYALWWLYRHRAAPNCFIHPTCRVKGGRVTLTWLPYAKVWQILGSSLRATLIFLPEQRHYLEVSHHCFLLLSNECLSTKYDHLDAMKSV